MKDSLSDSAGARTGEAAAAGDSRGPRSEPPHVGCYKPRTLRHDLEQHGRLPIPDCVQLGLSLATALTHLHEQGLVHRDIKPSNIIFVKGVAKLSDIGLVTEAGDTQSIVGTEGYLPPEGPGTPQADLFSLGKVLYEAVTGLDRRESTHFFKPFFRGKRARDRRVPGVGLGLSLVRQIARAHGGDVDARNLVNGGAEFRLRLPIKGAP